MAKYRKKPVVIEAKQWTGKNHMEIATFMGVMSLETNGDIALINTLEGTMEASAGDYIIRGIKGEYYPCKPDIFEATYDKLEDGGGGITPLS